MPNMKGQIDTVEDDFWTERLPFFTAQFPTYYREPKQVHGRIHASDERYFAEKHKIIPLSERKGERTYVMMQTSPKHPFRWCGMKSIVPDCVVLMSNQATQRQNEVSDA